MSIGYQITHLSDKERCGPPSLGSNRILWPNLVRQPLANFINMSASKQSVVCHKRKWKVVTEHGHTL